MRFDDLRKKIIDYEVHGISDAPQRDDAPFDLQRDARHGLLVMADYESSGIWLLSEPGWGHAMIDHDTLRLPESLAARFRKWIQDYWGYYERDDFDVASFNETGRELARDLKRFTGPDIRVRYSPQPATEDEVVDDEEIDVTTG